MAPSPKPLSDLGPGPMEQPAEQAVPIDLDAEAQIGSKPADFDLISEPAGKTAEEEMELPSVDIDEAGLVDEQPELAAMHEFIPSPETVGQPTQDIGAQAPKAVDRPMAKAERPAAVEGAGDLKLSDEKLERIARDTIEKMVWELVPQLAETILREEIEKLVNDKLAE